MNRASSFAVFALLSLTAIACAPSEEAPSEEEAASADEALNAASSGCTRAKYDEALGYYRKAAEGAKARGREEACEWSSDEAHIADVAHNAMRAAFTCAAFKNVIKTSPSAAKVRETLARTLTYQVVTGGIDPATWQDLESVLPGISIHGGLGHGDVWTLSFEANGAGTLESVSYLDITETTPVPNVDTADIRWSVERRDGKTLVKIRNVPGSGAAVSYDYRLSTAAFDGRTQFYYELESEPNDAFPASPLYSDLEGECGG